MNDELKPEGVKVIQLVSNTIPRPANPMNQAPGGFSIAIYGLGDDGNLYSFNFKQRKWAAA
jgi:hypothetical protein